MGYKHWEFKTIFNKTILLIIPGEIYMPFPYSLTAKKIFAKAKHNTKHILLFQFSVR